MIKLFLSILIVAGSFTAYAGNPGKEVLKVKADQSSVNWTAYKVTGKHNGSVAVKDGSLNVKDGLLLGGSLTMDMTSITVLDQQGGGKTKLEGHLKSDDFFGVENHPTATLVIKKAEAKGSGLYTVTADLTIKGITHPITFDAVVKHEPKLLVATADLKVDRTLYDIRYGSNKFYDDLGDKAIYDEFDLSVKIVAENN